MPEPPTSTRSGEPLVIDATLEPPQVSHAPQPESFARFSIEELLWRMRAGDRDAAAEFMRRYGSRIQRRVRGKLGPDIRRIFDSLDILSTLGRRLDLFVMSGRLQASNESQLWSLLFKMADHALVDKARIFKSMRTIEHQDSQFVHEIARQVRQSGRERSMSTDVEIEACLKSLDNPIDQKIFPMWLNGESYAAIGEALQMTAGAVRKRLKRAQAYLKSQFEGGAI